MKKPLISVIVPVFKVEEYLFRCVNSLLNQTFDDYEIILVDDGSPDRCPEMVDQLSSEHYRVRGLHKKNGGLGDARNYGIKRAYGDWIVVVDSDDYVEPQYLSDLWNLKEEFHSEMAMAWSIQVDENDKLLGRKLVFNSFVVSKAEALWEIYAGNHVGWSAYNKLYPKWVLIQYPFPDGYYEDMACMYRIVTAVESVAIGDFNDNYKYVQRTSGSILNSKLSDKHLHAFEICEEFCEYIDEYYPRMYVLKTLIYVHSTVQMLHRQQMGYKDFKKIFLLNRKIIREGLFDILNTPQIPKKTKLFSLFLSTEPWIYRIIFLIAKARKT